MSSVQYTRLPTEDVDFNYSDNFLSTGKFLDEDSTRNAFDYASPFTYSHAGTRKYKSAFTYTGQAHHAVEVYDVKFQTAKQTFAFRFCHWALTFICYVLVLITLPFSAFFSLKIVPAHERVVVFRLGRLIATRGPGVIFFLPCVDRLHKVDLRPKAFNVPPKQLITQDGALIEVGAEVFFKVLEIEKTITNVQDLNHSIRILLETTLMRRLLKKPLAEIETQTSTLVNQIQEECNKTCTGWGTQITSVELSQIKVFKKPNPATSPGFSFPPGTIPNNLTAALPQMLQQLSTFLIPTKGQSSDSREDSKPSLNLKDPDVVSSYNNLTPSQLLSAVQTVVDEDLVRKCACVYQFNISGDGGGLFYLDLRHGSGSAGEGVPPHGEADVTFDLTVEDMRRLFCGTLKPMHAYMDGSLKITGDMASARGLKQVLKKLNNPS